MTGHVPRCAELGCLWPAGGARIGDVQTCRDCGLETRTRVRGGWRYGDGTVGPLSEPASRPCLGLDFDGVLHAGAGWQPAYGEVDAEGIRRAHERGWAVAIITCSVLGQVAAAVRRAGFIVEVDHACRRAQWSGGPSGRRVLVTARKVDCTAFVDDRAVNHAHGGSWAETFAAVDALRDRRQGFRSCVPGRHRHWGPDGAAGLLPVASYRGRAYVLLGRRGQQVQSGGTWAGFGGAIEPGEDAWQAAQREALEEVEGLGQLERIGELTAACPFTCGWSYTTFPVRVPMTKIRVKERWETSAVRWVRLADVASIADLHPAFAASWPALAAAVQSGAVSS